MAMNELLKSVAAMRLAGMTGFTPRVGMVFFQWQLRAKRVNQFWVR